MTGNAKLMVAAALTCFLTLSGCGDEWNCSNGKCRLERNATGCLTKETYRQLIDEFNYINDTGDTTRIGPLYSGGQCILAGNAKDSEKEQLFMSWKEGYTR